MPSSRTQNRTTAGPSNHGGRSTTIHKHNLNRARQKNSLLKSHWPRMRNGTHFPSTVCGANNMIVCFKVINHWMSIRAFVEGYSLNVVGELPTLKQFRQGLPILTEETFYQWGVDRSVHPDMLWVLLDEYYRKIAREQLTTSPNTPTGCLNGHGSSCYYGLTQCPKGCPSLKRD